ncbi:MAG: alanine dehydrogenase [candidate division WOR-3 bacterium]|nr:MAG: alanine dehydrogenase [candidate division WOR-3 bacterium]
MQFGVPKEIPPFKGTDEYRVGLSPMGAQELILCGAKVYVESKAGVGAGFSDGDYEKAGATVVYSKEEAYRRAEILLKVRRPQQDEYPFIKEGQVIMGFIHLITARKEFVKTISDKKVTLVGYEIVQQPDGRLPIVIPFSEMAGKLSVQIAGRLLESPRGGRGILLGGIAGIPPAEVIILGGGTLGCNAAKTFAGIGANVYVLDIDRSKLDHLACHTANMRVTTMFATRHNIEKLIKFADVVIGAVLLRGKRSPTLVTKEMVKTMRRGSVIIDFSIDQGGCVETAKISPSGKFIYTVDDVIHFCMPNATSLIARTAVHALTSSAFPYLKMITELGFEKALKQSKALANGLYAEKGVIKKEFLP